MSTPVATDRPAVLIPRPSPFHKPDLGPVLVPAVTIARHPHGGWTHAVRVNAGTARVHQGHYPTARAAARALFSR